MVEIQDFDADGKFCVNYVTYIVFSFGLLDCWSYRAVLGHGRRVTIVVFICELFS